MAKGPIRMKVEGSGSVIPGAEPYTWKGATNGLLFASASSPAEASAAGLAVYCVRETHVGPNVEREILVIPAGAGDASVLQTLDAYCDEQGIGAAGKAEIENGVYGLGPENGEWVVCIPKIASYVVLHGKRPPYALRLLDGKPIHHVTKAWHKFVWDVDSRLVVTAEWAVFAPHLVGTNEMSAFIERKSNAGAVHANPGDLPAPEGYEVGQVMGDMAANLHPWPIDEAGNNLGIVTVYRAGTDASGSTYYESGPVVPSLFNPGASGTAIAFYFLGDANESSVFGLNPVGYPARVARNANAADPGAWFANPEGNPEGDPALVPVAEAWLPVPTNDTGAYRPGYYYRDGALVLAVAGGNIGLYGEGRPQEYVDGYPCLGAASAEGSVKYGWQLAPQPDGPKVWTEDGERFAAAATDRTMRQMWHFQEEAYPQESECVVAVTLETTGTQPAPIQPNGTVVGIYAPAGVQRVTPVGDAPALVSMTEHDGWVLLGISHEGLETEAGGYKPGQRLVYRYKVEFYREFPYVTPVVGDVIGAAPSLAFDEYRPYEFDGGEPTVET